MNEGAAIRAFASTRFLAMAEELAVDLRARAPTDVYGDDIGAKSLWDEYCYEARNGPTFELLDPWSSILDPLIAEMIDRLPHEEAVLLTIVEQWYLGSDDSDDADADPSSNPDMIAQAVRERLYSLAINRDWDEGAPEDEERSCWDSDEEPYCVLPLQEQKPRSLFAWLRRLRAAFSSEY